MARFIFLYGGTLMFSIAAAAASLTTPATSGFVGDARTAVTFDPGASAGDGTRPCPPAHGTLQIESSIVPPQAPRSA